MQKSKIIFVFQYKTGTGERGYLSAPSSCGADATRLAGARATPHVIASNYLLPLPPLPVTFD